MNTKRCRRLCALLVAMLIMLSGIIHAEGAGWIVSDLMGSVSADTAVAPEDDFHAYVNREWLATAGIPDGCVNASPFLDRELEVQEQIKRSVKVF